MLFDQRITGITFPASDLVRQLPTANKELLQIVEGCFTPRISGNQPADDIVTRTRGYIRGQLGSGLCNLESCAQQLHIHLRNLQRELAKNGFTFKKLVLDMRMELARDHLRNSDMLLSDLTDMLGYDNQSAFSRAFNREHGVSPKQSREASRTKGDNN